jgi:hypothetical protein
MCACNAASKTSGIAADRHTLLPVPNCAVQAGLPNRSARSRRTLSIAGLLSGLALGAILFAAPLAAAENKSAPLPALSVQAIAAKALPALVTVLIKDNRGQVVKSGSGFFIEPKRLVTNLHVISGADTVSVVTLDKRQFLVVSARIDEEHDLALLEAPEAVDVPTLPLGDPNAVVIGESVVAAGSPLGMQGTVSTGIVSAIRNVKDVMVLQTTAPISQGSSGGPLINSRGEVIGINSFMVADGQNLNFAQLSSHIAALSLRGEKKVDFLRGQTVIAKPEEADPNQEIILSLLAQTSFSGTEFKQSLIGEAELVLLDPRRQLVYFALSQADAPDGNDRARVNAVATKFVAETSRVTLGSDDGMQSRFPDVVFRRSHEKWLFFATDLENLRLRTGGTLKFAYTSATYTLSPGELGSYLSNASIRGGPLAINATHYAKELGQRSVTNWGALVALPGEPSLARLARELTKGIAEPEKKVQRLVDFVASEIKTDPVQTAGIAKRPSEVLMTRTGTIPHKAVLLASLLEQIPTDYILVYSGQDAWVAVPQGGFRNDNFLGVAFSGRQWTMLDVSRRGFIIGQTKSLAAPSLDKLVLAQRPQQEGRIYHRTTGMPVGGR